MGYAENARKTYGTKCEWVGCGWDAATCDVHHISYVQHQEFENKLRHMIRLGDSPEKLAAVLADAREHGYLTFNQTTKELSKDDRVSNLAVLCPNHHRYVHEKDLGMDLLKYIPSRRK
jgi:hypothetical protein